MKNKLKDEHPLSLLFMRKLYNYNTNTIEKTRLNECEGSNKDVQIYIIARNVLLCKVLDICVEMGFILNHKEKSAIFKLLSVP